MCTCFISSQCQVLVVQKKIAMPALTGRELEQVRCRTRLMCWLEIDQCLKCVKYRFYNSGKSRNNYSVDWHDYKIELLSQHGQFIFCHFILRSWSKPQFVHIIYIRYILLGMIIPMKKKFCSTQCNGKHLRRHLITKLIVTSTKWWKHQFRILNHWTKKSKTVQTILMTQLQHKRRNFRVCHALPHSVMLILHLFSLPLHSLSSAFVCVVFDVWWYI